MALPGHNELNNIYIVAVDELQLDLSPKFI